MTTYQRGDVTVDEHFARFGSKSYAINKITSVDVRVDEKKSSAWLAFAIIGVVLTLSSIGTIVKDGNPTVLVIGVALLVAAFLMYPKRITRSYTLMLATAAGEVQATTEIDENAINELRGVIETRIAASP